MSDARRATSKYGIDWHHYPTTDDGKTWKPEIVQAILLQEIRDELKMLNRLLGCPNFTTLPREIRGLRRDVKALTATILATKGTS